MFLDPKKIAEQISILPGTALADIGSGVGNYIESLSEQVGLSGRVYAVDILPDVVTRLQNECTAKGLQNVVAITGDVEVHNGTHLRDQSIDTILLVNTLFQTTNRAHALSEIVRIMKPMGQLVIVEWSDSFGGMGPVATSVITPEQLISICAMNGLEYVRDLANSGDHHYGKVFKKFSTQ